jgi:hypothetical protein
MQHYVSKILISRYRGNWSVLKLGEASTLKGEEVKAADFMCVFVYVLYFNLVDVDQESNNTVTK